MRFFKPAFKRHCNFRIEQRHLPPFSCTSETGSFYQSHSLQLSLRTSLSSCGDVERQTAVLKTAVRCHSNDISATGLDPGACIRLEIRQAFQRREGSDAARAAGSNCTPIRAALRQTTRHAWQDWSRSNTRSKLSGTPNGLSTIRQAPVRDRLRTVQSIAAPRLRQLIFPPRRVRVLGALLCSAIA